MGIVVTVDGPAGAGKSTVAKKLAKELGWRYLDTGALYRAVALTALDRGLPTHDGEGLGALTATLAIRQDEEGRTFVGDDDVSSELRTERVSQAASQVSAHPSVRRALVDVQRRVADDGPLICEGRDMGTVIFPDAALKVFLDASPRTRAERRRDDLQARGEDVDLDELVSQIEERDHRDANRDTAPLLQQDDQIAIDTSEMSIERVLERLRELVVERCENGGTDNRLGNCLDSRIPSGP
ncbi:MAG: cytidylate kinase [Planctomycetes bacterium]|nr:cytidylate kinase [Planctomycetota bacterium]